MYIKGLSLNNICLTKSNKGTCEHQQTKIARSQLLEPYQQLAEPVYPRMRGLHHPLAGLMPRVVGLLPAPAPDMGDGPAHHDDFQRRLPGIPHVKTQMLRARKDVRPNIINLSLKTKVFDCICIC